MPYIPETEWIAICDIRSRGIPAMCYKFFQGHCTEYFREVYIWRCRNAHVIICGLSQVVKSRNQLPVPLDIIIRFEKVSTSLSRFDRFRFLYYPRVFNWTGYKSMIDRPKSESYYFINNISLIKTYFTSHI